MSQNAQKNTREHPLQKIKHSTLSEIFEEADHAHLDRTLNHNDGINRPNSLK